MANGINFILDGLNTDLGLTTKPTFPTSLSSTAITGHLFTLTVEYNTTDFNNLGIFKFIERVDNESGAQPTRTGALCGWFGCGLFVAPCLVWYPGRGKSV